MICLRTFARSECGGPAAELALMLPLLVVMIFGSIEMGYYFYTEHQVIKGVRDGARFASRQSFEAINCTGADIPVDVAAKIREVTRTGRTAGGTARVPGWINSDIQIALACVQGGDGGATFTSGIYYEEPGAPIITITASVDYEPLFAGIGGIADTSKLNAVQQTAVMGI